MAITITGTDAGEDLPGSEQDEVVFAGDGPDAVDGYGGDDTVFGEGGNDTVSGGDGDDVIFGGDGDDFLVAGIVGSPFVDSVDGGDGDDQIAFSAGGTANGGAGEDELQYTDYSNEDVRLAISVRGVVGPIDNPSLDVDSIERLILRTGSGDDRVVGGDLIDFLDVGAGANRAHGWGGNDIIAYHAGEANTVRGGQGSDLVVVLYSNEQDTAFTVAADGAAADSFGSRVTGAEYYWLFGREFDDTAVLGAGNDVFKGGGGDDAAWGGAGQDLLQGADTNRDAGADSLYGQEGDDRLLGLAGADLLDGGDGRDQLSGGLDADTLDGGLGRDALIGGLGADRFQFTATDGISDVIRDFGDGDVIAIDTAVIDEALAAGEVPPERFSQGGPFGTDGQFVYSIVTRGIYEYGLLSWIGPDSEGAEQTFIALLFGAPELTADDLVLF
jgi:Ca2+-binding RTX toxin-like protein